jgi:hypothetical protein
MRPLKGETPAADRTANGRQEGSNTDIAPSIACPDQQSQCTTLETLLAALDASPIALRHERYRDSNERGDWVIIGKSGHIYADGSGYLLYVATDESPRRWTGIKRRLAFCRLTQDGDDEGCLRLDRQPTPAEAGLIRQAIGIKRRVHLSDAERARRVERARALSGTPFQPRSFVKTAGG